MNAARSAPATRARCARAPPSVELHERCVSTSGNEGALRRCTPSEGAQVDAHVRGRANSGGEGAA
eukprot:7492842-Alexandrium_andersonii.AAC.1